MSGEGTGRSPSLTDEQVAAVRAEGVSVALSASAGCGKTSVLTERYLFELEREGGRALENVVGLTFTEKAARELKMRIRARIKAMPATGPRQPRGELLIRGLEAAPIGTFHEFCASLVREHALELKIDPDFQILEPQVASAIRDEAVAFTLRTLLEESDPDLIELASRHGLGRLRQALAQVFPAIAAADLDFWAGRQPHQLVAIWEHVRNGQILPQLIRACRPLVNRCRTLLDRFQPDNSRLLEIRQQVLERIEQLDQIGPEQWPAASVELAELLKLPNFPAKGWQADADYQRAREQIPACRNQLRRCFQSLTEAPAGQALRDAEESLMLVRILARMREVERQFKERRGVLDFDDLLRLARELVTRVRGKAWEDLDQRLRAILVDEFQDTDRIQGDILRRLDGEQFAGGRLFVVGDVKQSIYRFRGAEPTIFSDFRQSFLEQGRLELTTSFRSSPGIIRFVNELFRDCFADLDPVSAGRPGGYDLVPARATDVCDPVVEFIWPADPDASSAREMPEAEAEASGAEGAAEKEDDEQGSRQQEHEKRECEAAILARRLKERLQAGWPVHDRSTGRVRPARPGDIALLFRALTDVHIYETALYKEGFDYYTVGGSAFYLQQEVRDVANLIDAVEDPLDELALAGTLRGPCFGLSDDALYHLARHEGRGLAAGLARCEQIAALPPIDRTRAERARQLLERFRSLKDRIPMARLLELMLDETGYEGSLLCEFLGDRKLANLRKLVAVARSFDRQGGFSLGSLAARLRAMVNQQVREEQAAASLEDEARVRLLSIHQAKGLEFPIVVIPDLGRRLNVQLEYLEYDPALGVLVQEVGETPSLGRMLKAMIERWELEAEALRLFYVAATRARDALLLSASIPVEQKACGPWLSHLESRFDRRTGALQAGAQSGSPIPIGVHIASVPADPPERERPGGGLTYDDLAAVIELAGRPRRP